MKFTLTSMCAQLFCSTSYMLFSTMSYYCYFILLFFVPDDDHRIPLVPLADIPDCQNDYINASYINVSTLLHIYIH